MLRDAIECLLGNTLRARDGSPNGGAGGAGFNVEAAAELGHAFAHAGNAHAEERDVGPRWVIGRELHSVAIVSDLQGHLGKIFAKTDGGGVAAGMALNVGEALLNDAEQGDFDGLRQAAEVLRKDEFGFDAATFAEAADIFLESGDKAELIEQRRM